ncbi:MAG: hypothetical protein OCD01_19095 [Fibrobacterales bacterium]
MNISKLSLSFFVLVTIIGCITDNTNTPDTTQAPASNTIPNTHLPEATVSEGIFDSTFNSNGSGFNQSVNAIIPLKNGKIIIGGCFTEYNDKEVPSYIIRLNADGTHDNTFNPNGTGLDDYVYDIKVQPDGKILVAGIFTTYNGVDVPDNLIRLNDDGSFDATFNGSNSGVSGFQASVNDIIVLNNNQILIAGAFSHYNESTVPYGIVRLNADGSVDALFNASGKGANSRIYTLVLQKDGRILIGGGFETYNKTEVSNGITRLHSDGSLDITFNKNGIGFPAYNGEVYTIAIQSTNNIILGGNFSNYNDKEISQNIIRLNNDGTFDTTFNTNGKGTDGEISAIIVHQDDRITAGGKFSTYNNSSLANNLIRLTPNGDIDNLFSMGGYTTSGPGGISTIALQSDKNLLLGGYFYLYNDPFSTEHFYRIN